MKFCHLCTDVCRKSTKASTSDPGDAQQRTCLAIRSITDLLMIDGLICLDFADVASVMRDSGRGVVGIGEAAGEGRAVRAAEAAILDVKRQLAAVSTTSEASLDMLSD
jgi:cell division GTPase FtsZ